MLSHAPASLLVKEAMEAGDSEPHDVGEVRSVVAGVFDAAVRDGMGRRAEPLPMPMRRLTSSPGMQPSAPRAGPRCTTRLSPSCAWGRCAAVFHETPLLPTALSALLWHTVRLAAGSALRSCNTMGFRAVLPHRSAAARLRKLGAAR